MLTRVHRSGDGVLYLTGGSNNVIGLYAAAGFAAAVPAAAWRERLAARTAFFAARGIAWRLLLAPEKLSVTGLDVAAELLGEDAVPPAERFCQLMQHPCLVDPAGVLRAQARQGHAVYPATDSHWTSLGAFAAFQWLMGALGRTPDSAAFMRCAPQSLTYHGDLWDPSHDDLPPDVFERRTPPASLRCVARNRLVAFKDRVGGENDMRLHTGSATTWHNAGAEYGERLLLFGSSFSDHRAACSLLTFVAALYFREVFFVWSTDVDLALVARLRPDLVVIEMPERFLPICPGDALEVDVYAEERIRAYQER